MTTPEAPALTLDTQITLDERVARIERILGIQQDGTVTGSDELLVLVSGHVSTLFNSPRAAQQLALGVLNQACQAIGARIDATDSDVDLVLVPEFIPGSLKVVMDKETREVSFFEKTDKQDVNPDTGWVAWTDTPTGDDLAEVVKLVINLGLEPTQAKFLLTRRERDAFLSKVARIMADRKLAKAALTPTAQ